MLLTTLLPLMLAAQPEPGAHAGVNRPPELEWVYHCLARDPDAGDLRLVGGRFPVASDPERDRPTPGRAGAARLVEGLGWVDENAAAAFRAPNPANRLQLVFVGDGYTAAELPAFAQQVADFAEGLFADEPLATYRPLFAVSRVDIVSNESGVDNDPTQGILRDTALNMNFWCSGIERLLCVSTGLAWSYAATAPLPAGETPDQVLALANSSKYGGAGYSANNLGTASARNAASIEVAVHELGHSLGNLADEYDYGGAAVYAGPEPTRVNVSKLTAAQMSAANTKWAAWLGVNDPAFEGLHDTYEGGQYAQFDIYRPTFDSKMRSLGRPFNLVSAEALIKEIYAVVDPIDSFAPTTFVTSHTVLSVTPIEPAGNPLAIEWFANGVRIEGQTGPQLDTCAAGLTGFTIVEAVVTDFTPWVRDEAFRQQHMSQNAEFVLNIPPSPADTNNDGVLTPADFNGWILAFNNNAPACDQNGDGLCTPADFNAWILNYNTGC